MLESINKLGNSNSPLLCLLYMNLCSDARYQDWLSCLNKVVDRRRKKSQTHALPELKQTMNVLSKVTPGKISLPNREDMFNN